MARDACKNQLRALQGQCYYRYLGAYPVRYVSRYGTTRDILKVVDRIYIETILVP